MKLLSKTAACLCAVMIAASAAAAVSAYAAESTAPSASASQSANNSAETENVKYGKVTAVNGSELTVSLGEFAKKTSTSAESGQPSENESSQTVGKKARSKKKKSSSSSDSAEARSSTKTADASESGKDKAGSKKHKSRSGHKGRFAESGTELTVKLTDGVTVTKKGETASLSDISEGDILKLEYDESGRLNGIKITKGHKHKKSSDSEGKKDKSRQTATDRAKTSET